MIYKNKKQPSANERLFFYAEVMKLIEVFYEGCIAC